jgi:hypothetical protein
MRAPVLVLLSATLAGTACNSILGNDTHHLASIDGGARDGVLPLGGDDAPYTLASPLDATSVSDGAASAADRVADGGLPQGLDSAVGPTPMDSAADVADGSPTQGEDGTVQGGDTGSRLREDGPGDDRVVDTATDLPPAPSDLALLADARVTGDLAIAPSPDQAGADSPFVPPTDTAPPPVALAVTSSGAGAGTITSSPAGINCGSTCTASFPAGTVVTLSVAANSTSLFTGWSGACSGTGACVVTMDAAKSVVANFSVVQSGLNVARTGTGSGAVTSSPAGINCGGTCQATFPPGTQITLSATPDGTSTFSGWSGACSGTATCTVTMDAAKSVTASFDLIQYGLTVSKGGGGGGTVVSSLAGIYCGSSCQASYSTGTVVSLTATPDGTSVFSGWTGACAGVSTATCAVTMDAAKSVTANFDVIQYRLTVGKSGAGRGTVTSSPGGIACGNTCQMSYEIGTLVTLTADPDATSTFGGWSGACTGTGTCTVTMDAVETAIARFDLIQYSLTINQTGTGSGTINVVASVIDAGLGGTRATCSAASCTVSIAMDAVVTLTVATSNPSSTTISTFNGWSGPCTGTGTCTLTMDAPKSVGADFTATAYKITINATGTGDGMITSSPSVYSISCTAGQTCTLGGSTGFPVGQVVTLSVAQGTSLSTFTGWSSPCSGTGTCTLTMDAPKSVGAGFDLVAYGLSVRRTGTCPSSSRTDGGLVSPTYASAAPGGVQRDGTTVCNTYGTSGSMCYFPPGTAVTLTPSAIPSCEFAGWSNSGISLCSGTGTCTVTVDRNQSITATFNSIVDASVGTD